MTKSKFNHSRNILNLQHVKMKSVYPGTMVQFAYTGDNIFDKKPLVLVLWNHYQQDKIHGINLNYLTDTKIKELMNELLEEHDLTNMDTDGDGNLDSDYDDTLPYRNMIRDPYTRIMLPTFKHGVGNNPLSEAEAKMQMERLYNQKLKRLLRKRDIYRTYKTQKMSSIQVVTYNIKGLT